jgi:hypothetical protein
MKENGCFIGALMERLCTWEGANKLLRCSTWIQPRACLLWSSIGERLLGRELVGKLLSDEARACNVEAVAIGMK